MGKWGNFMFLTKLYNTVIHSFQYTESTGHNVFLTLLIIFTGLFILSFIKHILQKMTKLENKNPYLGYILLIIIVFCTGLFLVIDTNLRSESTAASLDNAILYEVNGDPVIATAVTSYWANEVEDSFVSGTYYYRFQGINLKTEKLVFSCKLPKNTTFCEPRLLGSYEKSLFLSYNGIIWIYNGETGSLIKEIKYTDNTKKVALLPDATSYQPDQTNNRILFMANDGLFYALSMEDLFIQPLNDSTFYEAFSDEFYLNPLPENEQLYTDTSDSSLMLLSNLELESLDLAPSGIENTTVDARRFLYQTDYTNIGERTSITESPFLYGTFLSYSSLTQTPETASLDQDCVLIAHKSSLDNNASWLLSYVSISKKEILWTVDTKATAISNYYMPDSTHILLFCQNGDGTINMHSNTNYLSYVSLENGSATTYDFLYHDFSH